MTVADDLDPLAKVSQDEFVTTIERLIAARGHDRRLASEAAVLLRATLGAASDLDRLSGEPPRVHHLLEDAFADMRIAVSARRHIQSLDMLDAHAVAELLGVTGVNRREAASALRRRGTAIGLPVAGSRKIVYPAFQFDATERKLRDVVATVNAILGALADPWGVASWWATATPRLDGSAPMALLGTEGEKALLRLAGVAASA
jgi:hypothetical protein